MPLRVPRSGDRTAVPPAPLVDHPPRYTCAALPPYRFVPGGPWPHPVKHPAGHMHGPAPADEPLLPPDRWPEQRGYLLGVDLFNHAYWWEAHEAWEDLWQRAADADQRDFLHGLILLSAALLKWHLRNLRGVSKLLARSRAKLQPIAAQHGRYMGLDINDLLETLAAARLDEMPDDPVLILRPK